MEPLLQGKATRGAFTGSSVHESFSARKSSRSSATAKSPKDGCSQPATQHDNMTQLRTQSCLHCLVSRRGGVIKIQLASNDRRCDKNSNTCSSQTTTQQTYNNVVIVPSRQRACSKSSQDPTRLKIRITTTTDQRDGSTNNRKVSLFKPCSSEDRRLGVAEKDRRLQMTVG